MMQTFTRTTSGLQNYAKFFSADVTVYVEGRSQNGVQGLSKAKTYDELFYASILKKIDEKRKFVIKPVGSKKDVVFYATKISNEDIRNCVAIIDRDYENFLTCWTGDPRLIRTKGYSWESDFWTSSTVAATVHRLAVAHEPPSLENIELAVRRCAHRLGRVSKIDFLYKILDIKFIPSNGKSVGMEIQPKQPFFSLAKDIRKYNKKLGAARSDIKGCETVRYFYENIRLLSGHDFIRGHLWEYACLCIISNFYSNITGETSLPSAIGKNAAFSLFLEKATEMLDAGVLAYYMDVIGGALRRASGGA